MVSGSDFNKLLNRMVSEIKSVPERCITLSSILTSSEFASSGFFETNRYKRMAVIIPIEITPIINHFLALRFTRFLIFVQK